VTAIMRIRTELSGWQGAPGLSTLYFLPATVGGSNTDAADCAARVRAAWNAARGLFTTQFNALVQPQVDVIDDATGLLVGSLSGGSPVGVTGNNGTAFESIATMALLQMGTAVILRGRKLRGRLFLGPVATPNVTSDGQLLLATGSTVAAAFAATLSGSTASVPVIWDRPGKAPHPVHAGTSATVTTWACPARLSVLRSRRD
jgi:hypothetical protein